MSELTIGEVAERSGVPAPTLRYYEQIGILPEPERVGGKRRYASDVLQTLKAVDVAKQAGFTLSEIKTLCEMLEAGGHVSEGFRALAERKLSDVEDLIARAEAMRDFLRACLDCDSDSTGECGCPGLELLELRPGASPTGLSD